MIEPRQGEVYWADLDPVQGREMAKLRPVLIVSPDAMNRNLQTVVAAPITSTIRNWPTRCTITLRGKTRSVALDQIRCISTGRLRKKLASVDTDRPLEILQAIFAK